ncbi:MAG: hypothetical protein LBK23_05525 [Oscillospiraceae bacterium]|jgi:hypothetical protein|nr:hypothetical protein [Oscillospiraceae bacterium]
MDDYRAVRYKSAHTARRRTYGAGGPGGQKRRVSKLAVAVAALLIAIAARYAFPNLAAAAGDKISQRFNYRAALAEIGRGLTGERRFTEALGEAWSVAFKPASQSETASGDPTEPSPEVEPNSAEPNSNAQANPESEALPPDITPVLPTDNSDGSEKTLSEAALSAFAEASREYADYMTPAGAQYAI